MILVNNPGTWSDAYAPLQHSTWNGWTPADLIFPCFLFIMGLALTLSVQQRHSNGAARRNLYLDVVRRTLVILALGIFLNGFPLFDWSVVRIPGVLQRIAVCYGVTALIVLTLDTRAQALITMALVTGYWLVMALVPVPGQHSAGISMDTNLAAYVDSALLHDHLLHPTWDPEGLLSTLPAVATTLLGVLTGHWFRSGQHRSAPVARLVGWGVGGVLGGLVMDRWCPINKALWSSSYVLFTGGVALLVFTGCYWLIDIAGYRRWATPFISYGTNPIVAYVLSSLVAKEMLLSHVSRHDGTTVDLQRYLFETYFLPLASPVNASLLYAVAYVFLWLGVASYLHRRHVFIKV